VREAHVPVLLVRPGEGAQGVPGFRRVVIALSGADGERRVIDAAVLATDRERVTYTLLHVSSFTNLLPAAALGVPMSPGEALSAPPTIDEAAVAQARRYLDGIAAPLRASGVAVDCDVAIGGSVARAILDYARDTHADLIALATHAHAPLTRAVLGSVADKVMRSAPVSVLVVPPPDR
jgi:nucleotide-binding universal stress UspA family protein